MEKSFMKEQNATSLLFADLFDKPMQVVFSEKQTSSDGGAILLEAISKKMHLLDAFIDTINNTRQQGKIHHTTEELFRQRLFSIACGYPDANDVKRIEDDPILRMLAGLNPESTDQSLGSQPTVSRFENAMDVETCFQISCRLAEQVVHYQAQRRKGKRKPKSITLDMDPTDDPTHGQKVFSFFNTHYDNWCYLPQTIFIRFNDEGEQYLVGVMLRPGNAPATLWAPWVLRRLVELLQKTWPKIRIRVRLDGGFASPHVFDDLEWLGVEYLINMGKNSRLEALAEPLMEQARQLARKTGKTARVFGEALYAAHSWHGIERRVIIKAEVVMAPGREPKDNPRFVITNMRHKPENVYICYRKRGDCENRIKELLDLQIDRMSCHCFAANVFRVLLTSAAYMLIQGMRERIQDPDLRKAQVWTLREKLFKMVARIKITFRHIRIGLPETFAYLDVFSQLARSLGACCLGPP
jgi:hypothetical protein